MTDDSLAGLYPAYVALFFGALAAGLVLEVLAPRNRLLQPLRQRWLANVTLFAINQALFRALLPLTTVGAALLAADRGMGLLNALELPAPVAFALSLLVLDGAYYAMHRLEHAVPLLWRFHRLHHSDPDVDVSTGIRFHPVEALVQVATAATVTLVIGAQPLAAAVHMLLLGVVGPFSHMNVRIAGWLEAPLRWIVITPDMHRLHHSADAPNYQSNFALGLALWDRLFGTYRAAPAGDFADLRFGVDDRTAADSISLTRMLADPLRP
ncbi:MAG: sterol desaturase family protein [Chromatiales bacterium]|nr:sterol desaturase family protein [Chromatiales bacterium]